MKSATQRHPPIRASKRSGSDLDWVQKAKKPIVIARWQMRSRKAKEVEKVKFFLGFLEN